MDIDGISNRPLYFYQKDIIGTRHQSVMNSAFHHLSQLQWLSQDCYDRGSTPSKNGEISRRNMDNHEAFNGCPRGSDSGPCQDSIAKKTLIPRTETGQVKSENLARKTRFYFFLVSSSSTVELTSWGNLPSCVDLWMDDVSTNKLL